MQALKEHGMRACNRAATVPLRNERADRRTVLTDGQKLQHTASAAMDVQQPDRLHVEMSSARSQRELFYDGKQVTLFTPAQKYYATVAFDGPPQLADALQTKYGVELPLADLFVLGTRRPPDRSVGNEPARTSSATTCATTTPCARATSTRRYGSQLAQAAAAEARDYEPGRRGAAAVGEPDRLESEASLPDSAFSFKPPKGAKAIKMVRQDAVRSTVMKKSSNKLSLAAIAFVALAAFSAAPLAEAARGGGGGSAGANRASAGGGGTIAQVLARRRVTRNAGQRTNNVAAPASTTSTSTTTTSTSTRT